MSRFFMVQCVDVVWAVDSDGRKTVRTYLGVTKHTWL